MIKRAKQDAADRLVFVPEADASWLAPLLDPAAVAERLASVSQPGAPAPAEVAVKHVRYRPGRSCTALYEVRISDGHVGGPVLVYARAHAPGRGLPQPGGGAPAPGVFLDRPTPLADGQVVLREFPCDALLPAIAAVGDPHDLGRRLFRALGPRGLAATDGRAAFTTLRYKPEHRLILRGDLRWILPGGHEEQRVCQIRFECGIDEALRAATAQYLRGLLADSDILAAPPAETVVPELGCTVVAWREGQDLSRDLSKGKIEAAASAGRAFAALADLTLPHLPRQDVAKALDPTAAQVENLETHPPAPELPARFRCVLDDLARRLPPQRAALVHGDFHQGQMVTDGDGLCLLDWDRAHLGDPACDFGRFLAQLHLLDVRGRPGGPELRDAFRHAAAAAGGQIPADTHIGFWTVLALADLALREVRRLRPDWRERANAILDRCDVLLAEGGAP